AQGDQLVGVDGEVAGGERAAVLDEIAGHPVVYAGPGEVLDPLAEVSTVQLRPALTRRADQADREARVVRHRHQRRLAVAREALDTDLLRVHRLVGLEVVERPARAPRPGAQRPPVVRLARLALVAQADDALGEARAVVGLDAARVDDRKAPALCQRELSPGRAERTRGARRRLTLRHLTLERRTLGRRP